MDTGRLLRGRHSSTNGDEAGTKGHTRHDSGPVGVMVVVIPLTPPVNVVDVRWRASGLVSAEHAVHVRIITVYAEVLVAVHAAVVTFIVAEHAVAHF